MRLTSNKSCGRKSHTVHITVYNYETVEQIVGTASFSFEGSADDIANQTGRLAVQGDASSFKVCRYACCTEAAAATGLQDVEEVG